MLTELKKKEILSVKGLVDEYKNGIEATKAEIEVIDEKYRKMAEEEKKNLKATLAEYKAQQKVWEKMFNSFDTTLVKEALGYEVTVTDIEEQQTETTTTEDVVKDALFPENNEEEEKEEEKEAVPVLAEEKIEIAPVEDDKPVVLNEFENFGASTTEPFEEEIEPIKEVETEIDGTAEDKAEKKNDGFSDDDWPEYPDDWK